MDDKFLHGLFGEALEGGEHKVAIFALPSARTNFVQDFKQDIAADGQDLYFAVGLQPIIQVGSRAKAKEVTGITCLWADIDFGAEGHKGKKYPDTIDEAVAFLDELPIHPSIMVNSGGGLHAYWRFSEPYIFGEEKDRQRAAEIASGWLKVINNVADKRGWKFDSVADLARVMRLPGTINLKYDPPRECRVIKANGATYSLDDFEEWRFDPMASEKIASSPPPPEIHKPKLILRLGVSAPHASKLAMDDRKFRETWDRRRTNMADNTPSSYDFAIINTGVYRGWTDQEIANAIICWREMHNADPGKATRPGYIEKSIGKVRAEKGAKAAVEDAAEIIESDNSPEWKKHESIKKLSKIFKREMIRWVKIGDDRPTYVMHFDGMDEGIVVGHVDSVLSISAFKCAMYQHGVMIDRPAKEWPTITALLLLAEDHEHHAEGTLKGRLRLLIGEYLGDRSIGFGEDWADSISQGQPVIRNGAFHVCPRDLRDFAWTRCHMRIGNELYAELRELGFAQKTIAHERSSRSYWVAPIDDVSDIPSIRGFMLGKSGR